MGGASSTVRPAASRASRPGGDFVTILMTRPEKTATKRFTMTAAGIATQSYDAGHLFGVLPSYRVRDIFDLSNLLLVLEQWPNLLVVRGALRDAAFVGGWMQRTGDNTGTGNFQTPADGHHWIQIDFDKIRLPKDMSLKSDPVGAGEHLVSLLPREFQGTSYHATLSSSAGMGDPAIVSMHIWFWLERLVPDESLKDWAKSVNRKAGFKLIDHMLFQHVQAHYTAAPIFDGVTDPFPVRSWCIEKKRRSVRLLLPSPARRAAKAVGEGPSAAPASSTSSFERRLAAIGDHADGEGFHLAIVAAAASYVGTNGEQGTDVELLYMLIRDRVLTADSTHHDTAYVADMASREHIIPAIESAMKKFGATPRRQKTKLYKGVKPHYPTKAISVAKAVRLLAEIAKS